MKNYCVYAYWFVGGYRFCFDEAQYCTFPQACDLLYKYRQHRNDQGFIKYRLVIKNPLEPVYQ
jgi:hypothetical protein